MADTLRRAVAPSYLLLCLLLGGSAQGVWTNALLQLIGLCIIAWAAAAPADEPLPRRARPLLWIVIAGLAVVLLQLIPLPASLWPRLGGREALADGYRVLGLAVPARPLSLAPYDALATLRAIIPAIAMFCAIARLKAYRSSWLVIALLGGAFAGIALGALQVSSPDPLSSDWYLYPQSSFGFASGFFANVNNMGMLLVISVPFVAALVVSSRRGSSQRHSAMVAVGGASVLVLAIGVVLNRSLAGYGLAVPVVVASALLLFRGRNTRGRSLAIAAGAVLAAATIVFVLSPFGERALNTSTSLQSRVQIMSTTARAATDFLPFGSGLGTFREVYRLYEDHERITKTQAGHAHNDYLELSLELGVPGMLLIAAFLAWWAAAVWRVWRFADAGSYARAGSIASAVLLAHSLVEFPLRTAALSACFAMGLALMVERKVRKADRSDLRPTRHVELR